MGLQGDVEVGVDEYVAFASGAGGVSAEGDEVGDQWKLFAGREVGDIDHGSLERLRGDEG
ncbi:hypothetical protein ABWH91_10675 [Phycisphaerales bacterium ac7]